MQFDRTNLGRAACALIVMVVLGAAGAAQSFKAIDLQPLQLEDSWTYLENGVSVTQTVVRTESVNGVSTFVVATLAGPDIGAETFMTNDENGLRVHKLVIPEPEGGSVVLRPPGIDLQADFPAPSGFVTSGDADFTITPFGTFPGTYEVSVSVIGLEMVTVPAGTFQALRVDFSGELTVTVQGMTLRTVSTGSDWHAAGIGIVQSSATVDGENFSSQLVSTNVPEPSAALLGSAAFTVLAVLARRSKRNTLIDRSKGPLHSSIDRA